MIRLKNIKFEVDREKIFQACKFNIKMKQFVCNCQHENTLLYSRSAT